MDRAEKIALRARCTLVDHVALGFEDLEAARRLYEAALAPLGFAVLGTADDGSVGFGRDGSDDVWLHPRTPTRGLHLALLARTPEEVDAFHAAALAAGATDNGAPGPRPQYHDGYYGAFVLDAQGNNIEAVCHRW